MTNDNLTPQQILNATYDGGMFLTRAGSYQNVSTSAQTTIKSGAGTLGSVIINSSPTSAMRLYDNTVSGGDVIATIPAAAAAGTTYQYNVAFGTGLVISSGSADSDYTVTYN